MNNHNTSDFLVVGGGIVGLATAWNIAQRFPDAQLQLLEKEASVAAHQSGRNSGVLHSGIYYKPGSLKATTCRNGRSAMVSFCQQEGIDFEICGKVIVAVDDDEVPRLEAIQKRGQENSIESHRIDRQQLLELEPNANGVFGIAVPAAGIVDYPAVCRRLCNKLVEAGHRVSLNEQVKSIARAKAEIDVRTQDGCFRTKFLVTCGGLQSDKLVRLSGVKPPARIVPFRGEYYELVESRRKLVKNLIYPVPDPSFPFLGVHFTRMIGGEVECGPNAVLAMAREGYSWGKVNLAELANSLTYSGFLRLAGRHWKMGLGEIHRSLSKAAFVQALQRLLPAIEANDLVPCRAGVRAQALARDGSLIDDFLWAEDENMLHVCNAPSPAATASLEIGRLIAERVTLN